MCYQFYLSYYMRPKKPWQQLRCCRSSTGITSTDIPTSCPGRGFLHSRAPLSPCPRLEMWRDSGSEGQLKAIIPNEDAVNQGIARYCLYVDLACRPASGIMGPLRPQNPKGRESGRPCHAKCAYYSGVGFGTSVNLRGIDNRKRRSKGMSSPIATLHIVPTLPKNTPRTAATRWRASSAFS